MNLDKSKTYYLSGPMSSMPDFNYPAFNALAESLRQEGMTVENPAENPVCGSWGARIKQAITQLMKCHAIVMLEGWEKSRGANIEFDLALKLGMLVICESDLLTHKLSLVAV